MCKYAKTKMEIHLAHSLHTYRTHVYALTTEYRHRNGLQPWSLAKVLAVTAGPVGSFAVRWPFDPLDLTCTAYVAFAV